MLTVFPAALLVSDYCSCFLTASYTPKVSLNSSHLQALLLSMLSSLWVEFHVVHLSWHAKEQVTHAVTFKLKVVEDRAAAMEYRVKEASERLETRKRHSVYLECGLY